MGFLNDWPLYRLEGLYRRAKRTGFFTDPRAMVALREIVERKRHEAIHDQAR